MLLGYGDSRSVVEWVREVFKQTAAKHSRVLPYTSRFQFGGLVMESRKVEVQGPGGLHPQGLADPWGEGVGVLPGVPEEKFPGGLRTWVDLQRLQSPLLCLGHGCGIAEVLISRLSWVCHPGRGLNPDPLQDTF